jgi:hypothetical protein
MASVTLAQFRERARERADMENSKFVSDAELNRYVNASIQELYDLLIASRGENYYIDSDSFTTTNTDTYALPSDFLKLMGVDLVTSANKAYTLRAFNWSERNRYREPYYINDNANIMYQIRGSNIVLTPQPATGKIIKVWYIPRAAILVSDNDSYDGINGWEEYVVIDAAIKMRVKEESPIDELLIAKQDMKSRVMSASSARDSSEPARVSDVDGKPFRNWW